MSEDQDSTPSATRASAKDNPFRTAPGSEPPALVGRDQEQSAATYSFEATASGAPAQPIVFTGLRGMGKTALLRRCVSLATASRGIVISAEASRTEALSTTLRRGFERARRQSESLPTRIQHGLDAMLAALPRASYELPHSLGSISLEGRQHEDKGLIDADALDELNATVRRQGRYLVFAIDEIQEAPIDGLRDLVRFLHATAGSSSPAYLLGAGLPNSREHLHEVRTYTERWRYFRLGLLTPEQTRDAIARPARDHNVAIASSALDLLVTETAGYPFFVQEYASAAWLAHKGRTITRSDVEHSMSGVRRILEDEFYDARFRTLTGRECAYVLAMAELAPGPHTVGEISAAFGTTSDKISSLRNQLIRKDVIYAPVTGFAEFRIPLTERYILQHREELERRARDGSLRRTRSK